MNVAIITAYQSETREQIERCISSVRDQTLPATHSLIAEGSPQDWIGTVCRPGIFSCISWLP
jgi:hypothetical protein